MPSANHNVELHLRYTNCDSSLSPILALLGGTSNPLWLKIRSTGADVAGVAKTFSSKG